jgi:hypothetical protein
MFSIDTETGFEDVVFINATYGLGENVVQGTIDPDSFYVHKPTFGKGYRTVLKRRLGSKSLKMVFTDVLSTGSIAAEYTKNIEATQEERGHFSISDEDVMVLASGAAAGRWWITDPFGTVHGLTLAELGDGQYHTIELPGLYRHDAGRSLWFAPPNSAAVKAIFVDRVFAIRQPRKEE